jgi:hypothetical protein
VDSPRDKANNRAKVNNRDNNSNNKEVADPDATSPSSADAEAEDSPRDKANNRAKDKDRDRDNNNNSNNNKQLINAL